MTALAETTTGTETWVTTSSGLKFYPNAPEKSEYTIRDIAHALSNLCRFGGHSSRFYSVAEHSVYVSKLLDRDYPVGVVSRNFHNLPLPAWGLLHDAAEAYLTDLPWAVKYSTSLNGYRALETRVEKCIFETFGLKGEKPYQVKIADNEILRAEAKEFGLLTPEWNVYHLRPCGIRPKGMSPHRAELLFLARARELAVTRGIR